MTTNLAKWASNDGQIIKSGLSGWPQSEICSISGGDRLRFAHLRMLSGEWRLKGRLASAKRICRSPGGRMERGITRSWSTTHGEPNLHQCNLQTKTL